jgi:hypothetical protein
LSPTKLVSLIALALPLAACGGDDDDGGDDDGDVCVGHGCADAPILLPEGGEVRFEYINKNDDAPELRTSAWFASDQTPAARPWPRDPAVWSEYSLNTCAYVGDRDKFPNGIPESRTYRDMGDQITLTGGDVEFVLPRRENGQDDAVDVFHDILYIDDLDPADAVPDTTYAVNTPDAEIGQVYLPADYEMEFPDMNSYVQIPAGESFPFIWESTESTDPFQFSFVAFGDPFGPLFICIGPDLGVMEIPASVIDELPQSGYVQHGIFNHRVEALDERRLDLIGISCHLTDYNKVVDN